MSTDQGGGLPDSEPGAATDNSAATGSTGDSDVGAARAGASGAAGPGGAAAGAEDAGGEGAGGEDTGGYEAGMAGGAPRERLRGWFAGRLPADWFTGSPAVEVDREEITVIGTLPGPEIPDGASDAERAAAAEGRMRRFREETRGRRVEIAREAEHRFRRKVSWGVTCADQTEMFTTLSVPVMTRLRQPERRVLDTLVDAGVARSRSDALAWCVRLVGQHEDSWLADLRAALRRVEQVRAGGPRT